MGWGSDPRIAAGRALPASRYFFLGELCLSFRGDTDSGAGLTFLGEGGFVTRDTYRVKKKSKGVEIFFLHHPHRGEK